MPSVRGAISTARRTGDARASSANVLTDEFHGDYDAFRTAASEADQPARPAPHNECAPTFGNTDIRGGSYADPTP